MMWKKKLIEEAGKQQAADPEHMRETLDWYVHRVIHRMPTKDFVALLEEAVGLEAFFDARMDDGTRIRALAHQWMEENLWMEDNLEL